MNLDVMKDAAREALKHVATARGMQTDPDLKLYQQLKPGDFPKIMARYGTEGTLQYINEMEKRLAAQTGQKVGPNG